MHWRRAVRCEALDGLDEVNVIDVSLDVVAPRFDAVARMPVSL
jgi:hypothetical protein